jgi:TP901 family phage tail tape measure protein
MKSVGKKMSMAVTLPLVGLGGAAVNAGMKFESAMNQVAAVSGATAKQMQQMEQVAREMGATSKFSATEAAEGLNFLAMAGFSVQESMDALPATLDLAAAGNMQLGESADIVSNIMQGFAKDASQTGEVSDILTKTFTSANTSLGDLGVAMSYAAPTMNTFGQSIETSSAAIAALSDAGIQGSRAGTGLQQVMNILVQKGGQLGVSMRNAQGEMRPLFDILEDIEKQGTDSAKIMEVFGSRAGPALLTLLQKGSKGLREFETGLQDSGGTAKRVAEKQMQGLQGALTELRSALGELAIAFAKAGVTEFLEKIADAARDFALRLSKASDGTKKFVAILATTLAAIGPVSLAMGFMASNVIPKLLSIVGKLRGAFIALKTVMLANPFTAVAVALAAVGAAVYAYSQRQTAAEKIESRLNEVRKEATKGLRTQKAELNVLSDRLKRNETRTNSLRESLKGLEEGSGEYIAKSRLLKQAEEDRADIVDTLNGKYGKYIDGNVKVSDSYEDMASAIDKANAALKQQIKIKAVESMTEELKDEMTEAQLEIMKLQEGGLLKGAEEAPWYKKITAGLLLAVGEQEKAFNYAKSAASQQQKAMLDEQQKRYQAALKRYNYYKSMADQMADDMITTDGTAGGKGKNANVVGGTKQTTQAISAFQALQDEANQLRSDMQDALAAGNYDMSVFDGMLDRYNSVQAKIKNINSKIAADTNPFETLLSPEQVTSAVKVAERQLESDMAGFEAGLDIDISPIEQAMMSLDDTMGKIGVSAKAFGAGFNTLDAQLAAHKNTITTLIEQGYTLQDAQLKKLIADYKELNAVKQQAEGGGGAAEFWANASEGIKMFSQGLTKVSGLLNSIGQYYQAQMSAQISSMEEAMTAQGATEEEIAKKRADIREKYAKKEKKIALATTAMNIAQGVMSAFVPYIPGFSEAMAGIVAATGAVQMATIRAQPLAKGGIVPSGYPNDSYPAMLTSGETVVPAKKLPDFGGRNNFDDSRIVDAIKNKQETQLNITENGLNVITKKGNMRNTYISKKYRN